MLSVNSVDCWEQAFIDALEDQLGYKPARDEVRHYLAERVKYLGGLAVGVITQKVMADVENITGVCSPEYENMEAV